MLQRKEKIGIHWGLEALKLCIAAGALWFIWYKVFSKENAMDVLRQCSRVYRDGESRIAFLAALLLMPVNWGLEAWKWKMVIDRLHPLSFARAMEGVFSGLTVSFFTPNRVGEYAGRVVYLEEGSRIKGTLLTVMENLGQLAITLVTGSLALPLYLAREDLSGVILLPVVFVCTAFAALVIFCYLKLPVLGSSLPRLAFLKRYARYIQISDQVTPALLARILGWSLLRCIVFSTQLYLLLLAFGVDASPGAAFLMIVMTFFVLTLVPTFAFTDLGVRGAAGTFFFRTLTVQLTGVVYATVALWLINLALPAALGALLLAFSPARKGHAS